MARGKGRRIVEVMLAIGLGYAGIVAVVWFLQDLLVFPGALRSEPLPALPEGVRIERLDCGDGLEVRLAVATAPQGPAAAQGVLLFFVGNGEALDSGVRHALAMRGYGLEVHVPEYPGYGESGGEPSVRSFLAMAEAAAARARARAAELGVPLVVCGSSIGSFPAVHVAAGGGADRLLLRAPPTSLADAGRARFPWLPVRQLLRHDFDNTALAGSVACPTLILHGDADTLVPLALGEELAAAIGANARLVVATGFGHNDLRIDPGGPFAGVLREFLTGGTGDAGSGSGSRRGR